MQFPTKLSVDVNNPASRMLANGDVKVTVTNVSAGGILHVRFRAVLDNRVTAGARPIPNRERNWLRVPLANATHVFVEIPGAPGEYPQKVGTYYTRTGTFLPAKGAIG